MQLTEVAASFHRQPAAAAGVGPEWVQQPLQPATFRQLLAEPGLAGSQQMQQPTVPS